MKYYKISGWAFALMTLCFFLISSASAEVSIYAEGAYTDTDLKVYVYADVTSEPIVSFGVKLTYDANEVSLDEATCLERNDDDWYFGDPEGTTYETPNAGPDVTEAGASSSVVFVGGKLDTTAPLAGVVGDRILLGIVTFSRVNTEVVPTISVAIGKGGDYDNFVEVDGGLLDGTISPVNAKIYERGDANASGDITSADMFRIRSMLGSGEYVVYADCNGSGDITSADMFCVRSKL